MTSSLVFVPISMGLLTMTFSKYLPDVTSMRLYGSAKLMASFSVAKKPFRPLAAT
jgi:hypothetical protein